MAMKNVPTFAAGNVAAPDLSGSVRAFNSVSNMITDYEDQERQKQLDARNILVQDRQQANADRSFGLQNQAAIRQQSEFDRLNKARTASQNILQNFDGGTEAYGADHGQVNEFNRLVSERAQQLGRPVEEADIQDLLGKLGPQGSFQPALTNQEDAAAKLTKELMAQGITAQDAKAQAINATAGLADRTALNSANIAAAKERTDMINKYNMEMYKADSSAFGKVASAAVKAGKTTYNTSDVTAMNKLVNSYTDDYLGVDDQEKVKGLTQQALDLGYHPKDVVSRVNTMSTQGSLFRDKHLTINTVEELMSNTPRNGLNASATAGFNLNGAAPKKPALYNDSAAPLTKTQSQWNDFFTGATATKTKPKQEPKQEQKTKSPTIPKPVTKTASEKSAAIIEEAKKTDAKRNKKKAKYNALNEVIGYEESPKEQENTLINDNKMLYKSLQRQYPGLSQKQLISRLKVLTK